MNLTRHRPPSSADVEDFTCYVRARRAVLFRTAYLITGEFGDAEDLLQTALAKVYLAWPRIRHRGAADSYVRRTLVNTHTSRGRRRRADEYPTNTLPEPVAGYDPFSQRDLRDALWTALTKLTWRQRTTVVLRYYMELTEAETAAALGVRVGTVKSTTHTALARLRDDVSLRDSDTEPARPRLALAS